MLLQKMVVLSMYYPPTLVCLCVCWGVTVAEPVVAAVLPVAEVPAMGEAASPPPPYAMPPYATPPG